MVRLQNEVEEKVKNNCWKLFLKTTDGNFHANRMSHKEQEVLRMFKGNLTTNMEKSSAKFIGAFRGINPIEHPSYQVQGLQHISPHTISEAFGVSVNRYKKGGIERKERAATVTKNPAVVEG